MTSSDAPDRAGLAAELALGLLDGNALEVAEDLVRSDPGFAASVAEWRERLVELDGTAVPLEAGAALWSRIAASVAADPARQPEAAVRAAPEPRADTVPSGRAVVPARLSAATADGPKRRFVARLLDSLALWRVATAAGLAAAVLLGVALWRGPPVPAPSFVAVLGAESGRPGAIVLAYGDGQVSVIPLETLAVPDGRTLQVWTVPAGAQAPVAIGMTDRMRTLKLDLGKLSPARLDQFFAISLEPAGGSPTGLPTGPILMKGSAARTY